MHLFGNVRRREVNHDPQLSWKRRGPHSMNNNVRDELRDKGRLERDVDEARTSYFTSRYKLLMVANIRGNLSSHISGSNVLTLVLQ